MKGADNIKSVILADANESAEKIINEGKKRAQKITDEGKREADAFLSRAKDDTKLEEKAIIEKAETEGRLSVKKAVLAQKQLMIAKVFESAKSVFMEQTGSEFVATMVKIIRKNAPEGGEIVLNQELLSKYGEDILKGAGEGFTLCHVPEDMEKGALVRNGRIEINCRIGAIITRLMDTDGQEVSNILFGG